MIHSFRLRLALFSAMITGAALMAFGLGTWWLIRDIKIDRIDYEVRANAEREVSRTRSEEEWRRIEANIVSNLGVRDTGDLLLLVEDSKGEAVYRPQHWPASLDATSLPWPPRQELVPPRPEQRQSQPLAATTIVRSVDGHMWRIGMASTDRSRVLVAVDTQVLDADMKGIRNAFFLALPLAILLAGLGAWLFSDRAMRPVKRLTLAAHRVTAEGLDQRLPVQDEDREFVELIKVFNHMLERLERSFKQAHRFSADAAHELKTPLAILQGQLERTIAAAEDGSTMQTQLTSILDEVRRLSTISRKLLLLSQADAGRLSIYREPFDLSRALDELVEDARMVAPHLEVSGEIHPDLKISADGSLLRQVLHNLISNAIKYNVDGGWIIIAADIVAEKVYVTMTNSSPGISIADRSKIFERFYRADPAHSRNIEGTGLGLSVSREIARAHGGDLSLKESSDHNVTSLLLTLPCV